MGLALPGGRAQHAPPARLRGACRGPAGREQRGRARPARARARPSPSPPREMAAAPQNGSRRGAERARPLPSAGRCERPRRSAPRSGPPAAGRVPSPPRRRLCAGAVPLLSRPRGFLTQSTELRPPVGRPPPRTPLGPGAPAALAPARPSEDGTGGLSGPLPDAGNARGKAPYTPHARASAATLRPNVLSPLGRAARSRQRAGFGSRSTCKLPASALGFPSLPRALSALLVVRPPGGCAQAEEGAVPVLCPPSARVSAGGRARASPWPGLRGWKQGARDAL